MIVINRICSLKVETQNKHWLYNQKLEIRTANALIGNQQPHQSVKQYISTSYCDTPKQGVTSAAATALSALSVNVTQFSDGKRLFPATSYRPFGWDEHLSSLSLARTSPVYYHTLFNRHCRMHGFKWCFKRLLQKRQGFRLLINWEFEINKFKTPKISDRYPCG
jgi:hypothetical protein